MSEINSDMFKTQQSKEYSHKELQVIKNKTNNKSKKFLYTTKKISEIQNQIRSEQAKLRVKLSIQSHGVLIRHVY